MKTTEKTNAFSELHSPLPKPRQKENEKRPSNSENPRALGRPNPAEGESKLNLRQHVTPVGQNPVPSMTSKKPLMVVVGFDPESASSQKFQCLSKHLQLPTSLPASFSLTV